MMNECTKRNVTVVYSILILILAALFTVATMMPIVTIENFKVDYTKEYHNGVFTKEISSYDELKIGIKPIVDFFINFNDIQKIVRVQAGTETVDEAEKERLAEEIENNEDFSNAVCLFYAFGGLFDDEQTDSNVLDTGKLGEYKMDLAIYILRIILIICVIGIGLIFPIIVAVKFIIFFIKSLVRINKDTDADVDARSDRFPFTSYTAIMLLFYMLHYSIASNLVKMGTGIKAAAVIFLAVCLLRAIKTVLFADRDRVIVLIKQAVCAVSAVSLALLLFHFTKIDLAGAYRSAADQKSGIHYTALLEKLSESGMAEDQIINKAEQTVAINNSVYTAVILVSVLVGVMLIVIALINATERFADKKAKLKTGELVPHKSMIALAVVVLVISLIPASFMARSTDDVIEAFGKGQFKFAYNDKYFGSLGVDMSKEGLINLKQNAKEQVAQLKDDLKSADEKEAGSIESSIEYYERKIKEYNELIREYNEDEFRPLICVGLCVLSLGAEIAYLVIFKKREDGALAAE